MLRTIDSNAKQGAQTRDAAPPGALRLRPPAAQQLAQLQSAYGNQSIQRFLRDAAVQRKLTINQAGDAFEQEADRVADTVMRMSDPAPSQQSMHQVGAATRLQRCSCGAASASGQCEECKTQAMKLQRSPASPTRDATAPPVVHDVLNSPGRPLDAATRNFMEPRFGHDFSDV